MPSVEQRVFRLRPGRRGTVGRAAIAALAAIQAVALGVSAQTVLIKSDTPRMNAAADWGGTAPGAGYVGQFNGVISASNAASLVLGGNVTLDGLSFLGSLNGPVTIGGNETLMLGTNGIAMGSANRGVPLNCAVALAGTSPTLDVATTTMTIGANILGSGGFTKSGAGILLLSGSNSISGDVIVSAGTLRTGSTNALNSGNAVRLDSGATLNLNNSATIAGLNDNAGSGGAVMQGSGGGKVLTVAGSGSYSFSGNFTTGGGNKVGLALSGTGTQVLGGNNVTNTGYQSVTSGGTLIFSKTNSIFQGLSTGAVANNNLPANAGIYVSSNSTVALGVGDSASNYFDSAAIATFVDGTHMGASAATTGFASGSILGFDTTYATGGTFTYASALTNLGTSTNIGFAKLGTGTLVLEAANTYSGVTQIRAGTLQIGAGSTTGSISNSADITVSSGATLAFNRSDTALSQGYKITGAGSVSQSGPGTTTLTSATSDYSGGTSISAGRLIASSLGSGNVTISGTAAELTLGSSTTYSNAVSITGGNGRSGFGLIDTAGSVNAVLAGSVAINASPSVSGAGHFGSSTNNGSLRIDGAISSSVPVIFRRGTVILTASNGYATSTVISNGGTLQIGNGGTTGSIASTSGVTNNGTLTYHRSDSLSASYAISGSGNVTKSGAGTLTLSGANSYSGGTLLSAGALKGDTTSLQGAITNNAAAIFDTATNGTYAGVMSGTGSMTKSGAGTLTLSATNTYNGATTVEAGKLMVNGAISNSAVTVTNAGTLGGSGSVGALTIANGGKLAPGNSPGTLFAASATWTNGGSYDWEILNATGTAGATNGWDLLDVAGTLSLTGLTSSNFTINLITLSDSTTPGPMANFNTLSSYTNWLIVSAPTINGFSAGDFILDSSAFVGATGTFGIEQRAITGGQGLFLTYTGGGAPIPEPGTWAAAALLAATASFVRWRRRLHATAESPGPEKSMS